MLRIEGLNVAYGGLKALTDEWMDLFGYFAPLEVTDTEEE